MRERAFIALRLAPSAILGFAFLSSPTLEAATAPAEILDTLLLIASLASTLGLLGLLLPSRWARPVIGLTAGAGVVLSFPVVLSGVSSFEGEALAPVMWTVVAALGTLGSLSLAVPMLASIPGNLSTVNRLAAAFLAPAALIGSLQFWHQTSYLPAKLEATITVELSLAFVRAQRPTSNRGTAEISLKNEGDVATFIIISGLLICPREGLADLKGAALTDKQCIQGTRPFGARSFVEAESFLTHRQVFSWKEDATAVESLVRVIYARADRLRLGTQIPGPIECRTSLGVKSTSKIAEAYPILPASRHQSLVKVDKMLAFGPGSQGGQTYWITDVDDPSCERDSALLVQFGIRELRVASEEWIPEEAAPQASPQPPGGNRTDGSGQE